LLTDPASISGGIIRDLLLIDQRAIRPIPWLADPASISGGSVRDLLLIDYRYLWDRPLISVQSVLNIHQFLPRFALLWSGAFDRLSSNPFISSQSDFIQ
jgi:uncharacterized membrane protein YeiH